jgi:hypothetical protein
MQPFLGGETVKTFLHQISLTIAVLKKCKRDELKALPMYYAYPTQLHNFLLPEYQINCMSALNTGYYAPIEPQKLIPNMPVSKDLQDWINNSIKEFIK